MGRGGGNRLYDCIVVGGGPAGLSASLMLARYGRGTLTFHNNRPRNKDAREIHGFLGHDGINPEELLRRGRSEVQKYGGTVIESSVEDVMKDSGEFVVNAGTLYRTRTVLLATGVRDITPEIPGFSEFYGSSIHHCADCDGYEIRNKKVGVVGNGRSAVAMLNALRVWTSRLTLLTGGELPDLPDSDHEVRMEDISIITTSIAEIEGDRETRQLKGV